MRADADVLRDFFKRQAIADMAKLCEVLGTAARITVFRRLKSVGYQSSFTHSGRFYTLSNIPRFDDFGLWFHQDAGFSREGTLKETVAAHVERSREGRTHGELQHVLRVRVHNVLHELVTTGRIGVERFGFVNLYVSANKELATLQSAQRRELAQVMGEICRALNTEETIEVLAEALRVSGVPEPSVVSVRLAARGIHVAPRLVQQTFDVYGLVTGKKRQPRRPVQGALTDAGNSGAAPKTAGKSWAGSGVIGRRGSDLPEMPRAHGRPEKCSSAWPHIGSWHIQSEGNRSCLQERLPVAVWCPYHSACG